MARQLTATPSSGIASSETLGSVTVICSDKTDTLTGTDDGTAGDYQRSPFEVTRDCADGGIHLGGEAVPPDQYPELAEIARAAVLCNDAQLRKSADETWQVAGDPTEGALLAFAMKVGIDPKWERDSLPRTDAIPFESEHRLMATLNHDHEGRGTVYVKGAPERVFEMCDRQGCLQEALLDLEYWRRAAADAAADGLRLLAIAAKPAEERSAVQFSDLKNGFRCLWSASYRRGKRWRPWRAELQASGEDHRRPRRLARAIGAQLRIGRYGRLTRPIGDMDDARCRRC